MSEESSDINARFGRVEGEMGSLRGELGTLASDVTGLKSDVKGLGSILGRIELGVQKAQEKSDEKADRNKPNMVALISILITIISILVGGAWTIGGNISRMDERDVKRDREVEITTAFRSRENDLLDQQIRDLGVRINGLEKENRRPVAE